MDHTVLGTLLKLVGVQVGKHPLDRQLANNHANGPEMQPALWAHEQFDRMKRAGAGSACVRRVRRLIVSYLPHTLPGTKGTTIVQNRPLAEGRQHWSLTSPGRGQADLVRLSNRTSDTGEDQRNTQRRRGARRQQR